MADTGVLEGIRVLTLEQVHALPWGTAFLADFGAQVIRVESVDHMQDRRAGPFPEDRPAAQWWNEGGHMAYYGTRNKQSLCLEVVHPLGREVFLKLVQRCDVVTDNFRPGTMRRLGFDHDSLVGVNPRIITLSCTAYGHTGPWRSAGSRARTVDAACGLSYLTGYEGGPSVRASNNYMDHSAGNNAAYAILLALYHRRKTGKGMRIDLSMQETGVSAIGPAILEAQRGISRPRLGCGHLWKAPHNVFPCQGEDRWIAIAVGSNEEWFGLRKAMGEPEWATDPRYATIEGRRQNRHEIEEHLGKWTSTQDAMSLMHHLQAHGVPAGAVLSAVELVSNPHLQDRCYLQAFANPHAPAAGARVFAARPFRSPRMALAIRQVAALGEHNEEILRNLARLSDEEIRSLYEQRVISDKPKTGEPVP